MPPSPATRIRVYMEQVLEQTCRSLPHGGDHELRAFLAERLTAAAHEGRTTLGELGIVARKGLADYKARVASYQQLNSSLSLFLTLVQDCRVVCRPTGAEQADTVAKVWRV